MSEVRTMAQALAWLRDGAIAPGPGMADMGDAERRARELQQAFAAFPGALETILQMSLFRPPVNYALPRNGEFENYALVREGQNQVAAAILHYLDQADQLDRRPNDAARTRDDPGAYTLSGTDPFSAADFALR